MIVKLFINPETLEATSNDPEVVITEILRSNSSIVIEVSKPDPEQGIPWQQ